ncbi:MAG: lipid-A-disaccharide synthase [Saprospiraceae bacterium]|jgi:lipid-A-disaccharide synthase|nr:lipid-A-disaccharide synthase [Saprospiraceae bacterium]
MYKIYTIAGESSGDIHGSNLVREIKRINPSIEFYGWGGELMESEGVRLGINYHKASFMGFVEVIKHLPQIIRLFSITKKQIEEFKPHAILLIDYPGFNLRMAKWAFERNIRVYYYISPQVWAWKESRVLHMKKYIHQLFVILPFEKDFFKKHGVESHFVGHPLFDHIQKFNTEKNCSQFFNPKSKKVLALLPGSRRQEIKTMLPLFLQASKQLEEYHIVLAGMSRHKDLYHELVNEADHINILLDSTYNILKQADCAIVTSGTATLETALFKVPQVVCYKGNKISYWIAKKLVKVKYISLVNLILDKEAVTELIQNDCNPTQIVQSVLKLKDDNYSQQLLKDYDLLLSLLGDIPASKTTAQLIASDLNQTYGKLEKSL